MSSDEKSKTTNGVENHLSSENLSNVPDESSGGAVDRFSQSSAADEPYFARARMDDRSEHTSRLASQLNEADEIMNK